MLEGEKLIVYHLQVFGCGAYVYLLQGIRKDKMSPKSELMIYLGIALGGHGNLFMRLSGNVVFISAHAKFNKKLFPHCKTTPKQRLPDPNTQLHYPKNLSELESDDDLLYHQPPTTSPNRKTNNDKETADDDQQAHLPVQTPSQPHSNWDEGEPKEGES